MATRILFDPRQDLPDGTTSSAAVIVEATPTAIRTDGAVVVFPTTQRFTVSTAADPIVLTAPGAGQAWRLVVRRGSSHLEQRTVTWTDAATTTWAALTDVDPATLTPSPDVVASWDAALAGVTARVDAVLNAAPGNLDTFFEVATQMGLDEATVTTLTALVAGKADTTAVAATYSTLMQALLGWAYGQSYRVVSATRDANEAITTASVVWPDGATGTFTTDTASAAFPGAIDAYHVTHVLGGVTKTVTQTAVTRDAGGAVTAQPALTVA